MQKSYDSLKDNDIEVILLAYLLKHPELLDTHFEQISINLFANPENLKIFKVLEDFQIFRVCEQIIRYLFKMRI